jgi:hypothetical protein
VVAYLQGLISWSKYFNNVLLKESENIFCVVSNSCGLVHTWSVNKTGASYVGVVSIDESNHSYCVPYMRIALLTIILFTRVTFMKAW